MFNNRNESLTKPFEFGDSAVDGLFGGMLAGLFMEIYLTLSGIAGGLTLIESLTRLSPIKGLPPFSGFLLHFAVSGIYGMLFALVMHRFANRRILRNWGWLAGLVYGLILLLVAVFFILPNTNTAIQEIPPGQLAVAHLLFGLVLGWRTKK